MSDQVRVTALISGRVQQVGYRDWTHKTAQTLGITGYVRNLPNGKVEAVFEGDRVEVVKILELAKDGPTLARVEEIHTDWEDSQGDFAHFDIR